MSEQDSPVTKQELVNHLQIFGTQLKTDIVNSVGSMFVDLKGDIRKLDGRAGRLETKVDKIEDRLDHMDDELIDIRKTMKDMRGDVNVALESQNKILAHEAIVKNHEKRITKLESPR